MTSLTASSASNAAKRRCGGSGRWTRRWSCANWGDSSGCKTNGGQTEWQRERIVMRAIVVTQLGGAEFLLPREMTAPVPGEHDLLIEVFAGALNPIDFKIRRGAFAKGRVLPFILGFDVRDRKSTRLNSR